MTTKSAPPRPPSERPRARLLRAFLELSLLTALVFAGTFFVLLRTAQARLEGAAQGLFPTLLEGEGSSSSTHLSRGTLHLNGIQFEVESRSLPGSPEEQSARLRESCPGFSMEGEGRTAFGRSVICLRTRKGKDGSLVSSLKRWAETEDLRELGAPEVSFLRSTELAGAPATHLLHLRTRSLAMHSAFPQEGDAPGLDPSFAPRPEGRRILSAHYQSAADRNRSTRPREVLFAYESAKPPAIMLKDYEQTLLEKGFRRLPTGETGPHGAAFSSDKDTFIVIAGEHGSGSWLSLALLPKTGSRT